MFDKLFKKDPLKKLDKEYKDLLERAMTASRNGDMDTSSDLYYKADQVYKKIEAIKGEKEEKA